MIEVGSKVKLKLKSHDGETVGFVALGTGKHKKYFLGTASETDATTFVLENYKGKSDIFYYKVDGTDLYLDEHTRNGVVFPETPFVSAAASSIHAWKLNDEACLEAVYGGKGTSEVLSPAHNSKQDKIEKDHHGVIFCNFEDTTRPFEVEIVAQ